VPLLTGARRPPLSFNISFRHGPQQQTRPSGVLQVNDGTDRQTLWTPDSLTDPALHTMQAVLTRLQCSKLFSKTTSILANEARSTRHESANKELRCSESNSCRLSLKTFNCSLSEENSSLRSCNECLQHTTNTKTNIISLPYSPSRSHTHPYLITVF